MSAARPEVKPNRNQPERENPQRTPVEQVTGQSEQRGGGQVGGVTYMTSPVVSLKTRRRHYHRLPVQITSGAQLSVIMAPPLTETNDEKINTGTNIRR